jgi:Flp pilus assembly protein TadG
MIDLEPDRRTGGRILSSGRSARTDTARSPRRSRDDSGMAIVWFALTLVLLMGFVGFAIDLSNWWRVSNQLQAGADAAALAGVVRLPGNLAEARVEADRIAEANQTDINDLSTQVTYGAGPDQLKVTTTATVDNFFLGVLGFDTTTIRRTATAEYQGPIPMGSPENLLGSDPETAVSTRDYWLEKEGEANNKSNGDRFSAAGVADAIGNKLEPTSLTSEYDSRGYSFIVRVGPNPPSGELVLDLFDPAFINVGATCDTNVNQAETGMPDVATAADWQDTSENSSRNVVPNNPLYGQGDMYGDAVTRYANTGFSPFCTGDTTIRGEETAPGPWANLQTDYVMRYPSTNAADPLGGGIIDTVSCPASARSFAPVGSRRGNAHDIQSYLSPTGPTRSSPTGLYVRQVFHRWVRVCRIANPAPGDYIVQVVTPDGVEGQNRFSMRAAIVPSASNDHPAVGQNQHVKLFANGRLPIYSNARRADGSVGSPEFYLAEIDEGNAGRVLTLEFWDIGDIGSTDGNPARTTFAVIAPSGGITCSISPLLGGAVASGCELMNISSIVSGVWHYQAQLVTVRVQLPANYQCSTDPMVGCWFRIRMGYSANARPTDVTTWTARLNGDPVRLVRNP